ncbi:hypothetical protein [Ruegeria denitrificans]|uniref:hypothetical protein n=1 Tax=Ruegeria denitrificans TaxID=1715692 RepID=UPI003C7A16F6
MAEFSSTDYWQRRYEHGKTSGAGSYGRLAVYKANFINTMVEMEGVDSVVELGSGDGNQAQLFDIPKYTGLDVSDLCVRRCNEVFRSRPNWVFKNADSEVEPHDVSLSLDVIYHLTEDSVFDNYMRRLFGLAQRYVVIYSSDFDLNPSNQHVRHRPYSAWIEDFMPGWQLYCEEENPFAVKGHAHASKNSFAAFKVFERR